MVPSGESCRSDYLSSVELVVSIVLGQLHGPVRIRSGQLLGWSNQSGYTGLFGSVGSVGLVQSVGRSDQSVWSVIRSGELMSVGALHSAEAVGSLGTVGAEGLPPGTTKAMRISFTCAQLAIKKARTGKVQFCLRNFSEILHLFELKDRRIIQLRHS